MEKIIENTVQVDALFLFCDIVGFSSWMEKNQFEANDLLDMFYSSAFNNFGIRLKQKYHNRVVKLLGDGIFVVYEYKKNDEKMLMEKLEQLISAIITFRIEFENKLNISTLHGKKDIKCSFGIAYGPCMRLTISGYSLDYVSHKINYASRLVSVAESNEVVFEYDLWDYIGDEIVYNKRKDIRVLKKMGSNDIGVFDADI
jgi:class 3 adenylate cyclase